MSDFDSAAQPRAGADTFARHASILWIAFVVLEVLLAITIGSVTQRDLLLGAPVRLPILNVDLALVAFFAFAPLLLLTAHAYVLTALADTVYSGSRRMRLLAWATLILVPALILLQAQVTVLPYHLEWLTWLQRLCVVLDVILVLRGWRRMRATAPRHRFASLAGIVAAFLAVIFSVCLATFPGEWADRYREVPIIPKTLRPHWSTPDEWTSLHGLLFAGGTDTVDGHPDSLFSNRLVVTDQAIATRTLRGRNLVGAILDRSDFRNVDFSGANLDRASLFGAKLTGARFTCGGGEGRCATLRGAMLTLSDAEGADFTSANLEGAFIEQANLKNANFQWAILRKASLVNSTMNKTDFTEADLTTADIGGLAQDADFAQAKIWGALFGFGAYSHLRGVSFAAAHLEGAGFGNAFLEGADFRGALLQGADFSGSMLQGANFEGALLQGAKFTDAKVAGASFRRAHVWRVRGLSIEGLVDMQDVDTEGVPQVETGNIIAATLEPFQQDTSDRLAVLDPKAAPADVTPSDTWKREPPARRDIALTLAELGCWGFRAEAELDTGNVTPIVARALIRNGRLEDLEKDIAVVAEQWAKARRDRLACPGAAGLTRADWASLDNLLARYTDPPAKPAPAQ